MKTKVLNKNLNAAKASKKDEFYTQLTDIEKEVKHYKPHFKGKTVLCNCDDPRESNFFHYFSYNFEQLGLKKLIATCYKNQNADLFTENKSETAVYLEYYGDKDGNRVPDPEEIGINPLKGDGDFRSKECIKLLQQADIVWFTNIDNAKRHEDLILFKKYNEQEYPKYDNYDAIEVTKVAEIPKDFKGVMGVPITFLDKYNPEQFDIVGSNRGIDQDPDGVYGRGSFINGKETFKRLFIRNISKWKIEDRRLISENF